MIDTRNIHSLTDFLRHHKSHVARLRASGQPQVLTVNGRAELVIQDAASYQAMLDRLARAEGRAFEEQTANGSAGVPQRSLMASPATGTPTTDTPKTHTPTTGTPATGTPATGTPATGTPATGTPATGTPATGTPATGTPATGTPATGTEANDWQEILAQVPDVEPADYDRWPEPK